MRLRSLGCVGQRRRPISRTIRCDTSTAFTSSSRPQDRHPLRGPDNVAARLGLTFPDGYAEYVTELGEGLLSGYLRIWSPRKVEAELAGASSASSPKISSGIRTVPSLRAAGETVMLGDTMDGDDLVFHPERPDDLFVLPRHDDQVYRVGPGLDAAIDWLCDSGVLTRPMPFRYFEPHGDASGSTGRSRSLTRSSATPWWTWGSTITSPSRSGPRTRRKSST